MRQTLLEFRNQINLKNELLAGITVAMTMIPESLSFAILAGLSPLTGLYAAFLMGLVTAVLGGRPGMVSGGAGATVVVLIALAASHGVEYLFAALLLAGLLQFLVGVFKWGKFVRLIPQPVMYGFLNGLAIIIFVAQLEQFKVYDGTDYTWLQGHALYVMLGLLALTIGIVTLLPKWTKAIPASLVAIVVVLALVYFGGIETKRVMDIASISGSLPQFQFPMVPFTWETLKVIAPYAVVMAGVGLVESLLTLNLVDEITHTKGNSNREAMAQGTANVVNGFFGGMGGCAMIAQTFVNLNAGGRTRISAVVGALTILLIILVGAPVIGQIPMVALVGVMMIVAISTFEWASLKIIRKMPKSDIFIGMTVAAITVVFHNLAVAVLAGVVISALVFAWDNAQRLRVKKSKAADGRDIYTIYGPLFFGSTTLFLEQFDWLNDAQEIVIDFKASRLADMSAIDAVHKLTEKYEKQHKVVTLRHLSPQCIQLLDKAAGIINVHIEAESAETLPREKEGSAH